ncbi:MAG: hypothetical protein R6V33_07505 [Pelovirga sp.]
MPKFLIESILEYELHDRKTPRKFVESANSEQALKGQLYQF